MRMTKHIDPVCGMQISDSQAAITEKLDGETYYFCSIHCRESFLMAPGAYLRARNQDAKGRCCGH